MIRAYRSAVLAARARWQLGHHFRSHLVNVSTPAVHEAHRSVSGRPHLASREARSNRPSESSFTLSASRDETDDVDTVGRVELFRESQDKRAVVFLVVVFHFRIPLEDRVETAIAEHRVWIFIGLEPEEVLPAIPATSVRVSAPRWRVFRFSF
jgi:hypothetical protein